jgi:hypothetical protein
MQYPTKDNSNNRNPSQPSYGANIGSSIFQNLKP